MEIIVIRKATIRSFFEKVAKKEVAHIPIEKVEIEIIEKRNFELEIPIGGWVEDGRDDPNENIEFYKKDSVLGIKKFFEEGDSKIKPHYGINIPEMEIYFFLKNFRYEFCNIASLIEKINDANDKEGEKYPV